MATTSVVNDDETTYEYVFRGKIFDTDPNFVIGRNCTYKMNEHILFIA